MTNPMSVRAIPLNRRDDFEADEPFTVTGWGTLQVCHDLRLVSYFKNFL